jgi:hypothetical protein
MRITAKAHLHCSFFLTAAVIGEGSKKKAKKNVCHPMDGYTIVQSRIGKA